ncbi:uncharacterized protein HMPREF1541_02419 [Cyphellophora europaea CBS 101466]|uniref:Uncharacterized protein n=1 Tax=Cyphellophora europaea (strain CBS 101466) TaxID=1220924 RepID=W2S3T0_CYPE1|nr:uncharacterized protein HMPREF1541_02419 [Cyphellophora europaea CBS 101466]ETN43260.1 hypothetical protein HMPREF1541_02419 [Cyphellophora europaea CBS 101466]
MPPSTATCPSTPDDWEEITSSEISDAPDEDIEVIDRSEAIGPEPVAPRTPRRPSTPCHPTTPPAQTTTTRTEPPAAPLRQFTNSPRLPTATTQDLHASLAQMTLNLRHQLGLPRRQGTLRGVGSRFDVPANTNASGAAHNGQSPRCRYEVRARGAVFADVLPVPRRSTPSVPPRELEAVAGAGAGAGAGAQRPYGDEAWRAMKRAAAQTAQGGSYGEGVETSAAGGGANIGTAERERAEQPLARSRRQRGPVGGVGLGVGLGPRERRVVRESEGTPLGHHGDIGRGRDDNEEERGWDRDQEREESERRVRYLMNGRHDLTLTEERERERELAWRALRACERRRLGSRGSALT